MNTPTPLEVAREIRAEMGRQGVTAASLARATDMTAATLSRRFANPADFTFGELEAVTAALSVSVATIINRATAVAA